MSKWWFDKLRDSLNLSEEDLQAGKEILSQKPLHDFIIAGTEISSKITNENRKKIIEVAISFEGISQNQIETLADATSDTVLITAFLLARKVPIELFNKASECGIEMLKLAKVKNKKNHMPALAVLFLCLMESIEKDELIICTISGFLAKDLLSLLNVKTAQNRKLSQKEIMHYTETGIVQTDSAKSFIDKNFWKFNSEILKLKLQLKADELPAGLFRRLNPLPLGGYEEEIESDFEECYAIIARRAQAYAMSLRSRKSLGKGRHQTQKSMRMAG